MKQAVVVLYACRSRIFLERRDCSYNNNNTYICLHIYDNWYIYWLQKRCISDRNYCSCNKTNVTIAVAVVAMQIVWE